MKAPLDSGVAIARMYRVLHGSPMLAGVPAHLVLVLLAAACLGGFGLMTFSTVLGFVALGVVVVAWAALAFTFGQDPVAVSLFLLRAWHRFPPVVSSYTRSYARVLLEEA
jgi:hypothetical protein